MIDSIYAPTCAPTRGGGVYLPAHHLFDVGLADDSHWPTPVGRSSSVPVLTRSFEKLLKLQPALLCSCTGLGEEYTLCFLSLG